MLGETLIGVMVDDGTFLDFDTISVILVVGKRRSKILATLDYILRAALSLI